MAVQEIIYGTSILFQVFVSFTSLSLESVIHNCNNYMQCKEKAEVGRNAGEEEDGSRGIEK